VTSTSTHATTIRTETPLMTVLLIVCAVLAVTAYDIFCPIDAFTGEPR
jgi:hypothetical protein